MLAGGDQSSSPLGYVCLLHCVAPPLTLGSAWHDAEGTATADTSRDPFSLPRSYLLKRHRDTDRGHLSVKVTAHVISIHIHQSSTCALGSSGVTGTLEK